MRAARHPVRIGSRVGIAVGDGGAWIVGLCAATWFRYDGDLREVYVPGLIEAIALAIVLQFAVGLSFQRFAGRQVVGAVGDAIRVAQVMGATGCLVFTAAISGVVSVPRSVPITASFVAMVAALGMRLALRLAREHRARPDAASAQRVIVFGAGWGGQQIIRSMLSDAASGYLPVAVIDDDPSCRGRRLSGVAVRGTRDDLPDVALLTGADLLVVAVRDIPLEVVRQISAVATRAGLQVKVIPALHDLFREWIGFSDLRDLDIADLIGRKPVEIDLAAIADYVAGRTVLVTGAGGSIGSELCRQLHQCGPGQLLMLDRDESALHALQLSIHGRALLDSPDVILADIRDAATLERIFQQRRPDVVFHAAALKHLPMLEQYPHEAWQSNVIGTGNVLEAAMRVGVERFVNISTDKAANPTSVLGFSKRIGERLVADAAARARTGIYLSVRFGNVIGSRGSVLTTFAEQISAGQPITITHPDVTRFFMTIPEAVRLVVQAAAIGRPGEALVLDMGEPVRIQDIALQLTALAGRSVQILYTGLRNGEKLHEVLFGDDERDVRPVHPSVSHVSVPPLPACVLERPVLPDTAYATMAQLTMANEVEDVPAADVGRNGADTGGDAQVFALRRAVPTSVPAIAVGDQ